MHRASPAQSILIDFGGTLDADGEPWSLRFHRAYTDLGGRLEFSSFEPVFQKADRAVLNSRGIRTAGFRQMVQSQAEVLLRLLGEGPALDAGAIAETFRSRAVATVERNRPVLERLRAQYRLGIVSNFTGNLEPCLEELGIRHLFGAVVDSAVLGAAKPDPRPFVEALQLLETHPDQAWMVGDNFESDITPALSLGMRACWLRSRSRHAREGHPPCTQIGSFLELEAVIG
ncbi:MAG: HAD family hydrolase [Candidatus Eisenbacteria bacterium]|uniref:HAD family hydrolase n=1 Tax=Eiseniibacteriota bacterium TaxID=2212470 RepID=A0A538T6V9_UNCEI|nr:MAG: HAD family hydrolase [Candidatus Eisenbacteria bacterium]